ncbi:hypothetical protein JCM9140_1872 [Halalkalibacter wakoensis JCM 9140]|uniref:Uncharacterized protein n=1 Tax=Halalkalibacter wakoensis JCM 9140 TaxID=1236970 RepID=W4Q194_9BACI|nr:hypothetical protein [Halalkalibacter wakoensis]GAE25851.1 hypothetical protein JCM9140_1872 [Halalkalibacter wakoensis JCM 9140]
MANKSAGRKPKLSETEVKKVIKMFKENVQPMGNINFSEIHRYSNQLYAEGEISASTSDSFWRKSGRPGRVEVEKANEIFSETVAISKGKEIRVPNVVDLVNKKYKNKDDLLKHLMFMEKQFHKSIAREEKLEKELLVLKETLQKTKTNLEEASEKNDKLQGLVYRLSRVLSDVSSEEIKKQTEYAMKTVFSTPAAFLKFEDKNKKREEPKILPFSKDEQKSKLSNRFRK